MIIEYCIGGLLLILSVIVHMYHVIHIRKKYVTPLVIDKVINHEMTKQHIPGLCLSILKNGKLEYLKAYGESNIETKTKMNVNGVFEIGSLAKQFTAVGILLLVQDGKLRLEDSIQQFFPESPLGWQYITVYQLLTHTSGLGDYPKRFDVMRNYKIDDYLQIVYNSRLYFPAGYGFKYSNLGYTLLGIIISQLTGSHYFNFLKSRIFNPLHMTSVSLNSHEKIIKNRVHGYHLKHKKLINDEFVSEFVDSTADGGICMNIIDMSKWETSLNNNKLLKEEYFNMLFTPSMLNDGTSHAYGFGFELESTLENKLIYHDGLWRGYSCSMIHFTNDNLTVIVMTNLAEARPHYIAQLVKYVYLKSFIY